MATLVVRVHVTGVHVGYRVDLKLPSFYTIVADDVAEIVAYHV